jgi:hypothetical protein
MTSPGKRHVLETSATTAATLKIIVFVRRSAGARR